jgi:hypothetical protein
MYTLFDSPEIGSKPSTTAATSELEYLFYAAFPDQLSMANPMYFGVTGNGEKPYDFATDWNFNLNNTNAVEHRFMVQPQIQTHLQLPTQQYSPLYHDFLFSSGISSQHQAKTQPCFSTAQTTSERHPPRPMDMSRSISDHSALNERQQRHSQHRLSSGDSSTTGIVDGSRSSMYASIMLTSYQKPQAAPQPREAQDTGCATLTSRRTVPTISTMDMRCDPDLATANTTSLLYDYSTGETRSLSSTERSDPGRIRPFIGRENKTFGLASTNSE